MFNPELDSFAAVLAQVLAAEGGLLELERVISPYTPGMFITAC